MSDLKDKNILFLCTWYPARIFPANGNFIFKHARCLLRKGIPVTILNVCEDASISKRFEMVEGEEEGVNHLIIYYRYSFSIFKFLYKVIGYFKGMRYLRKKKGEFDLIHVNVLIDAGFIALMNFFLKSTPYVITEHNSVFLPENPFKVPFLFKPIVKWTIQKSAYILPVAEILGFYMSSFFPKTPVKVIPNVVDANVFNYSNQREKSEKINFIHISNFVELKNVKGILRVIKQLSEVRTDFTLTIAGDGDLKEMKSYAEFLNIPLDLISFHGEMTEAEVANILSLKDVFVLFSDFENLPCVLVEAQMSGMPLVATDVGGIREILRSKEDGILIPARDESKLLESLHEMINNFDDYNGAEIRQRAVKKYSEEAVADAFISIYKDVLKVC